MRRKLHRSTSVRLPASKLNLSATQRMSSTCKGSASTSLSTSGPTSLSSSVLVARKLGRTVWVYSDSESQQRILKPFLILQGVRIKMIFCKIFHYLDSSTEHLGFQLLRRYGYHTTESLLVYKLI